MQFGLGLMLTTAFSVLKVPKLFELYQTNQVEGLFSIGLFIVTLGWLGGWIYFDHQEIQYIEDYFDTKRVKMTTEPFVSALVIGILSGLLVGFTDKPRFYIIIAIINWVAGMYGTKTVREKIKKHFSRAEKYQQGPSLLICNYYMKNRFYTLDTIALGFMILGLFSSWYSFFTGKLLFYYIGFVIAILTVLVHEAIIWNWRIRRNQRIDEYIDAEPDGEEKTLETHESKQEGE